MKPVVDLLTPKGWVPVAYGDVQVSVPPSWKPWMQAVVTMASLFLRLRSIWNGPGWWNL